MTRSRSRTAWIGVDAALARDLVAAQFPEWAHLPIEQLAVPSTDNVSFRLGDELVVRIPWRRSSSQQVLKEWRWLPRLAPSLPLAVPEPVALGRASGRIPWRWSVLRWIEAERFDLGRCDLADLATSLGSWVAALQDVDAQGGPRAGAQNGCRGTSLSKRDAYVRRTIAAMRELIDADAVTASWNESLCTPRWHGPLRWVHGDLHPGNLLARDGRLAAVLDFGCVAVGDPAVDLMAAWHLPAELRARFRAAVGVDDATWVRGRGCALYQWIGGLDPADPDNEAARVLRRILEER